jgi:hypothetical protein
MNAQDALGLLVLGSAILMFAWLAGRCLTDTAEPSLRIEDMHSRAAAFAQAVAAARAEVRQFQETAGTLHLHLCPDCHRLAVHQHDSAGGCYLRDVTAAERPTAELAASYVDFGTKVEIATGNPGGPHLCVLGPLPPPIPRAALPVWSQNCCREGSES